MYLTRATLLNCGPIEDFDFKAPFNGDIPQPVVLVGRAGAGKTNLLSILADGLLEISAQHFRDILPQQGMGHQFYRLIGSATTRVGAKYELAILRFEEASDKFFYRAKSGNLDPAAVKDRLVDYEELTTWPESGIDKASTGNESAVRRSYMESVHVFYLCATKGNHTIYQRESR
jgi:hypothetical protein